MIGKLIFGDYQMHYFASIQKSTRLIVKTLSWCDKIRDLKSSFVSERLDTPRRECVKLHKLLCDKTKEVNNLIKTQNNVQEVLDIAETIQNTVGDVFFQIERLGIETKSLNEKAGLLISEIENELTDIADITDMDVEDVIFLPRQILSIAKETSRVSKEFEEKFTETIFEQIANFSLVVEKAKNKKVELLLSEEPSKEKSQGSFRLWSFFKVLLLGAALTPVGRMMKNLENSPTHFEGNDVNGVSPLNRTGTTHCLSNPVDCALPDIWYFPTNNTDAVRLFNETDTANVVSIPVEENGVSPLNRTGTTHRLSNPGDCALTNIWYFPTNNTDASRSIQRDRYR